MSGAVATRSLLDATGVLDALSQHAMAWFPKEACGLLVETETGAEVVRADNLQDRYHALDPEAYPRQAEQAYVLNPLLLQQVEEAGNRVAAIVHSHCRVGAYFSDKDQADATSPFGEGPLYPGVDYVVLDAQEDGVRGYRIFGWSDDDGGFVER